MRIYHSLTGVVETFLMTSYGVIISVVNISSTLHSADTENGQARNSPAQSANTSVTMRNGKAANPPKLFLCVLCGFARGWFSTFNPDARQDARIAR